MTCRHCGTEIADKALVCYRCGHATSESAPPPERRAAPGNRFPVLAALAVLVLGAVYMAQAAAGTAPRAVSWSVAGLAAVVLVWWVWRVWREHYHV